MGGAGEGEEEKGGGKGLDLPGEGVEEGGGRGLRATTGVAEKVSGGNHTWGESKTTAGLFSMILFFFGTWLLIRF